jgi:hypothetical protein
MKILAAALFMFSLPGMRFSQPAPKPVTPAVTESAHKGGRWYLAQSGHAVYCYGPVRMVSEPAGGLKRVATYCIGGETMVPLRD